MIQTGPGKIRFSHTTGRCAFFSIPASVLRRLRRALVRASPVLDAQLFLLCAGTRLFSALRLPRTFDLGRLRIAIFRSALDGCVDRGDLSRGSHLTDCIHHQFRLIQMNPVGAGRGNGLLHIVADSVQLLLGEGY